MPRERYVNLVLRNCYGFVKVKVALRGSELCVMLSLGKGMVKIGLSKDWVKPVCPRRLSPPDPHEDQFLNIKLTKELGAGAGIYNFLT